LYNDTLTPEEREIALANKYVVNEFKEIPKTKFGNKKRKVK
jgi:hypothetical protein